jgi:hypothetical protein
MPSDGNVWFDNKLLTANFPYIRKFVGYFTYLTSYSNEVVETRIIYHAFSLFKKLAFMRNLNL